MRGSPCLLHNLKQTKGQKGPTPYAKTTLCSKEQRTWSGQAEHQLPCCSSVSLLILTGFDAVVVRFILLFIQVTFRRETNKVAYLGGPYSTQHPLTDTQSINVEAVGSTLMRHSSFPTNPLVTILWGWSLKELKAALGCSWQRPLSRREKQPAYIRVARVCGSLSRSDVFVTKLTWLTKRAQRGEKESLNLGNVDKDKRTVCTIHNV